MYLYCTIMFFYYTFLGLTSEIDVSTMFGIIYLSNQRKICSQSCNHSKSDFHVDFKVSRISRILYLHVNFVEKCDIILSSLLNISLWACGAQLGLERAHFSSQTLFRHSQGVPNKKVLIFRH